MGRAMFAVIAGVISGAILMFLVLLVVMTPKPLQFAVFACAAATSSWYMLRGHASFAVVIRRGLLMGTVEWGFIAVTLGLKVLGMRRSLADVPADEPGLGGDITEGILVGDGLFWASVVLGIACLASLFVQRAALRRAIPTPHRS